MGFDDVLRMPLSKPEFKTRLEAFLKIREQSKKILATSEEKNLALIEAIPDLIFVLNEEGVFIDYHAPDDNILYDPTLSFLGKNIRKVLPAEVAGTFFHHLKQVKKNGLPASFAYELEFKEGTKYYEARLSKIQTDKYLIISRDITQSHIIKLKLQESESRLKEAQRIAKLGHWDLDIVNNCLFWSDEIYRIFEIDPNKFGATYEAFLDLIHPEDRETVDFAYTNSLKTRTPYSIEHRLLFPDGRIKYVHERCETEFDEQGRPIRSLGTVQDITERKKTEIALRESEEKFKKLSQISNEGIGITIDGLIVEANEQLGRLTDYGREELLGMPMANIIHPEDHNLVFERIKNKYEKPYEFRLLRKDGAHIYVEVRGSNTIYHGKNARVAALFDITARRKAEAALRESEEKFSTLFEAAPSVMILTSMKDGKIAAINKKCTEITGYAPEEAVGKTSSELGWWKNSESRDNFFKLLKQNNGYVNNFEAQFIHKNGNPRDALMMGRIIKIKDDDYLLTSLTDISERKILENELLSAKNRLESIFQSVHDAIFLLSIESGMRFRFIAVNNAFLNATGVKREQVEGHFVDEVIPEPSLSLVKKNYKKAIETKNLVEWEESTPYPNGMKHGIVNVVPVLGQGGKCTHLVGSVHDITEIKNTLAEKEKLNSQMVDILENMSDAFVSLDKNWFYTYMNKKAGALFNRNPKEMIGKHIWTEFPEGVGQPFHRNYEKAMNEKVFIQMEDYYPPWNKWFENRINPIENGIAIFFSDITQRKKNEEEILRLNKELEKRVLERTAELLEANRELEEFAYSISHDLRAPLRSIMGFSEIIARRHKTSLNDEAQKYFDYILKSGKHMSQLIDDLLDFARTAKGKIMLQTIDLNKLLNSVLVELDNDIQKSEAKITVQEDLPYVEGTETLLKQVFANLLVNAMIYTREGLKPEIEISAKRQDKKVIIIIKDNGIGIDKKYHRKIFNIFQRLHTQEQYSGTGIGLSIVKKALKAMNGNIQVESKVGEGTSMILMLNSSKKEEL